MIVLAASLPPRHIIRFFEQIIPGFWGRWLGAADWAFKEIDADVGGETIITSWWRSPSENRRVSGAPDSQHLVGLALDLQPGRPRVALSLDESADRFRQAGFIAVSAVRKVGESHLHVQTFPPGLLRDAGVFDALGIGQIAI